MRCAETDRPGRARGFTLLELLLVLLLIGILANAARVSIARREDGARPAAEQLLALAELASEEAILRNRELGLQFHRSRTVPVRYGYAWSARTGEAWSTLAEPPFEPRWFPESMVAEVQLDGRRLRLPEQAAAGVTLAPQLRFNGSGEWERFRVELRAEAERIVVEGEPRAALRLVDITGAR